MSDNTYWMWTNNFDGTANEYECKNEEVKFLEVVPHPFPGGKDPDKTPGISVNIDSGDSAETVALKTEQAIKRALPEGYSKND